VNCPNCNTPNEPHNTFCANCGQSLTGKVVAQTIPLAKSTKELLGIMTFRIVVILIGLWLVHIIFNWLPFVREMRIPGLSIGLPVLITSAIYLIIVIVLFGYVKTLSVLWRQSFPQVPEFGSVLVTLVYIAVLVAVYFAFRPLILTYTTDPNVLTVFQAILFVIAIMLIVPALITLYQSMPRWMAAVGQFGAINSRNQVACLSCGHISQEGQLHCSNCGAKLILAD
jgi:hypothetical protein